MIWLILACGPKSPETPDVTAGNNPTETVTKATPVEKTTPEEIQAYIILDGTKLMVNWDDGDTFNGRKEDGSKIKARLMGYNTLESYSPVHQWGDWTAEELYKLAKEAGVFASATEWECTDTQKGGGYGRMLVDCPDLRKAMLQAGLAHPFSVGSSAPEGDLADLQVGIDNKAGIWAKGVPTKLITSLHSQDEKPEESVYNRVCDMATGDCGEQVHSNTYTVCEKVCVEDSCMYYIPYQQRYGSNKTVCTE